MATASAHEVNPAYLELRETDAHIFQTTWKQPLKDGRPLRLTSRFSEGCDRGEVATRFAGGAVIENWTLYCDLRWGAPGIDVLPLTLTDVFVRIDYRHGERQFALLRPNKPALVLSEASTATPVFA